MHLKRTRFIGLVLACLMVASGALAADSVVGKWSGKAQVSGVPFQLSTKATFAEDGTFTISCFGLSATGTYVAGADRMTVTLTKLSGMLASQLQGVEEIGTVELAMTLKADSLSFSASELGLDGTLTLKRQ